ncbi:MAG: DUF2726 domain-containing protein [Oscillospiraceae bacterium]|nr:DUF2726 domain-containing protein [Oscillospiraceae bacterium]
MTTEIAYLILIALVIYIYIDIRKRKNNNYSHKSYSEYNQQTQPDQEINTIWKDKYQPRNLLTINERDQYRKLKAWASNHDAIVFTKVRVLDIIEPRNNTNNYKTLFYKIQAKHVDFVICDQNINVKCIIELDDNSHKNKDRKERDKFLDEALTGAGYKILHTKYITAEFLSQI